MPLRRDQTVKAEARARSGRVLLQGRWSVDKSHHLFSNWTAGVTT